MYTESHTVLRGHPKTKKLVRILGVSLPAAIGHLHCLWWWALDYAPDGNLTRFDPLDIAIGGEWEGDPFVFVDALIEAGFLERDLDGALHVHDWDQYGGKVVHRKERNAERMRGARATNERNTCAARAQHVSKRAELDKSREDKTREEENIPPFGSPPEGGKRRGSRIPDDFTVDDGMRAWAAAKGFSLPEIEHHTEAFCTYWRSESGAKATKVDWSQAWRTWFLREKPGKWPGTSGTARAGAFGRASPDDIPPMGTEAFRNYEASVRYVAGMSVRPDWDGTDGRGNIVRRIERTADGAAASIPGPGAGGAIAAARPGGRASPVGIAAD